MKELQTERLTLKPMSPEYLESTHEYASDPENTVYMLFLPNDSIDDTLNYLKGAEEEFKKEKPSFYEMAVILDGKHIGAVSLYLNESGDLAEFGWMLNKRYHGKGYGVEAAKALMEYGKNELGIRHFIAHCDTENIASRRVMEKLGMVCTGEHGGRHSKNFKEERREFTFEISFY